MKRVGDHEPLVYILILNYNSFQNTQRCIKLIRKLRYTNYKVIIIDNASPDNSGQLLHDQFPQNPLIQTGKNLGYAGGNNIGIQHAIDNKADYVWIVNPDIRVTPESLTILIGNMQKNEQVGVCGPRIAYLSGKKTFYLDGITRHGLSEDLCSVESKNDLMSNTIKMVTAVIGCSICVRTEVFLTAGLFRTEFFMYKEEEEFCLRVSDLGWKIGIFPKALNYHPWNSARNEFFDKEKFVRRNNIVLGRIRKKEFLPRFYSALQLRSGASLFFKLKWPSFFLWIKNTAAIVIDGLRLPLGPIPYPRVAEGVFIKK